MDDIREYAENERLAELYKQTLTDMYGEEQALAFLDRHKARE